MQTLINPIVTLHVVVVFFPPYLPYANINLTVLWCLCRPASFRGANPLTLPSTNTVNSGFCLHYNSHLMLMLTDCVIIPGILMLTHTPNTHILTHNSLCRSLLDFYCVKVALFCPMKLIFCSEINRGRGAVRGALSGAPHPPLELKTHLDVAKMCF